MSSTVLGSVKPPSLAPKPISSQLSSTDKPRLAAHTVSVCLVRRNVSASASSVDGGGIIICGAQNNAIQAGDASTVHKLWLLGAAD